MTTNERNGLPARKDRHVKPRVVFHVDESLLDALHRCVAGTRPRTTLTAVLTEAVERYLESRGLWPPAGGDQESSH